MSDHRSVFLEELNFDAVKPSRFVRHKRTSKEGPTVAEIKLPIDSERDFKHCVSLEERREAIDSGKVEYISLYVTPCYENSLDKFSDCWIFVKLPKEIDGIGYVPIIIFTAGGIDFYPGTHKYFLRSFDKRTRHLILGFCYENGKDIETECYFAGKFHDGHFQEDHLRHFENLSIHYKDSDAPKRIDLGPSHDDAYESIHPIKDNYKKWIEYIKSIE